MKKFIIAAVVAAFAFAPAMANANGAAGANAQKVSKEQANESGKLVWGAGLGYILLGQSSKDAVDKIECYWNQNCETVVVPPETTPPETTPPTTTTTTTTVTN